LQVPKSSTYMLLASLEGRGYVLSDAQRRFSLHPALSGDGRSWAGGFRGALLRAARPQMQQLTESTGESAFLAVLRPDLKLEYIYKVVSGSDLRVDAVLGAARPLHATSAGLVLLAFGDPKTLSDVIALNSFPQLTPRTISSPEELLREITRVRRRGYSSVRDTNSAHAAGMAMPLWEATGKLAAALTLAAPSSRINLAAASHLAHLKSAAANISKALGCPHDATVFQLAFTEEVND
jgi:DNA-binding IclR family transcriptional regulator